MHEQRRHSHRCRHTDTQTHRQRPTLTPLPPHTHTSDRDRGREGGREGGRESDLPAVGEADHGVVYEWGQHCKRLWRQPVHAVLVQTSRQYKRNCTVEYKCVRTVEHKCGVHRSNRAVNATVRSSTTSECTCPLLLASSEVQRCIHLQRTPPQLPI
eukprot:1481303-Rhodomonas_salina.1